jgi:8-oxo-dGTP diphosphatase
MSQADLGRKLGGLLGKPWSRQTVSAAEQGRRAFTGAELFALASVLETRPARLLAPPIDENSLELPSGVSLTTRQVADVGIADQYLGEMWDDLEQILALNDQARSAARSLKDKLTTVIAVSETATMTDKPERQPVVAAIVTSAEGILVTKRKDGVPPWGFLTGEIEPGERPEDAAVRECKEEAGLLVRAGQIIGEREHPQTRRHMVYMAAEPTHGTSVHVGDEAELAEVRWVSLAEADELLPGMYEPVREYLARELGAGERKP